MEIDLRGLTKTFGRVTAVCDVSCTAAEGKVTGFLGPNGSGKTTTLRMALGLVRPTAGKALIGGVPYDRLAYPRRCASARCWRRLAFIPAAAPAITCACWRPRAAFPTTAWTWSWIRSS